MKVAQCRHVPRSLLRQKTDRDRDHDCNRDVTVTVTVTVTVAVTMTGTWNDFCWSFWRSFCLCFNTSTKSATRKERRKRTEIPIIIDPSATINYPSAMGSMLVGISVSRSCFKSHDNDVHMIEHCSRHGRDKEHHD